MGRRNSLNSARSPREVQPRSHREDGDQALERQCKMQEFALEHISVDFQHLKLLIERVVLVADCKHREGADSFSALLQRLRDIIAAGRAPSEPPEPSAQKDPCIDIEEYIEEC